MSLTQQNAASLSYAIVEDFCRDCLQKSLISSERRVTLVQRCIALVNYIDSRTVI